MIILAAETGFGIGFVIGYWITDGLLLSGRFAYHNFGVSWNIGG
jgi:RNA-splicing ligase RtcB